MATFTVDKETFNESGSIIATEKATGMSYKGKAHTRSITGKEKSYEVFEKDNRTFIVESFSRKELKVIMKAKNFDKMQRVHFQYL